jgi:hypothetical protein
MKRFTLGVIVLTVLMYFSIGMGFADSNIPNLKGKWATKSYAHHHKSAGYFTHPGPEGEWVISEQQGRFFYGKRSYTKIHLGKAKATEAFSGVISRDGKRVYIVDHEDDILIGDVLSNHSIEFVIINEGEKSDKSHHAHIGLIEIERVR